MTVVTIDRNYVQGWKKFRRLDVFGIKGPGTVTTSRPSWQRNNVGTFVCVNYCPHTPVQMIESTHSTALEGETGEKEVHFTKLLSRKHS